MKHRISNKELLSEIWKSKLSFALILDPEFTDPTISVNSLEEVTEADVTFRLNSDLHIPRAEVPGRGHLGHLEGRLSHWPFLIYRSEIKDGKLSYRLTVKSHYRGGSFNPHGGRLTNKLGMMILLLVQRYALKWNWRNYSFRSEMESEAILNLAQHALRFNEANSSNAFAYFSTCATNSFLKELKKQRTQVDIRDALFMNAGLTPSWRAQDSDK